jgi:hypothetical protein
LEAVVCRCGRRHRSATRKSRHPSTALIESNLEFIMGQLARVPTRRDLAMAAFGIIISTAALVILWGRCVGR